MKNKLTKKGCLTTILLFIILIIFVSKYTPVKYCNPGAEGVKGCFRNIVDSKKAGVFIEEYECLNKDTIFINEYNLKIDEAWLEKNWRYTSDTRMAEVIGSHTDCQLVITFDGDVFNYREDILLYDDIVISSHYSSIFHGTDYFLKEYRTLRTNWICSDNVDFNNKDTLKLEIRRYNPNNAKKFILDKNKIKESTFYEKIDSCSDFVRFIIFVKKKGKSN